MNGDDVDFDPELTFEAAVQDFHNGTMFIGDNPERMLAAAQVQALLVIAHQLGAIARYYETAEAMLRPPHVHSDDAPPFDRHATDTSQDGHEPSPDIRNLVAEGADLLARWARQS